MDSVSSTTEQLVVKPYVIKLYEDGLEKGMAKGIEQGMAKGIEKALSAFLKRNPDWTDQQIAQSFDVREDLVRQIRTAIKKGHKQ